jgi:hypothetical protein
MGATIKQTVYEVLEPGYEDRSIRAWAAAKLTGGKRPSKLYIWASVLLFSGRPLPEGFDLDIDHLVGRSVLLVLEVVQKDGVERNRVAQLIPIRRNGAAPAAETEGRTIPAARPAGKPGVPVAPRVEDPTVEWPELEF